MGIARNLARLVPNGSGLLPNANIEAVAASKLTGQVADANAPSGSVIQVVSMSTNTSVSTNSESFSDTGLTATITPLNTSSRILIIASFGDTANQNQGSPAGIKLILFRNATKLGGGGGLPSGNFANQWNYAGVANAHLITSGNIQYVDSPASTSALTYKFQFATQTNNRTAELMRDNTTGTLILMEISG